MIPVKQNQSGLRISDQLKPCLFEAKTLIEIQQETQRSETDQLAQIWNSEPNHKIRHVLRSEYEKHQQWCSTKPTKDQRRSQRYFENLADNLWQVLKTDSFTELRELAAELELSTRLLFRILSVWADKGLIEMINRNRPTLSKAAYVYDIRKKTDVLTRMLYVIPKDKQPELFQRFRKITKTEVKWTNNGK